MNVQIVLLVTLKMIGNFVTMKRSKQSKLCWYEKNLLHCIYMFTALPVSWYLYCFNIFIILFRPRLGQTLNKVLAAGILYFILASIEGCVRVQQGVRYLLKQILLGCFSLPLENSQHWKNPFHLIQVSATDVSRSFYKKTGL